MTAKRWTLLGLVLVVVCATLVFSIGQGPSDRSRDRSLDSKVVEYDICYRLGTPAAVPENAVVMEEFGMQHQGKVGIVPDAAFVAELVDELLSEARGWRPSDYQISHNSCALIVRGPASVHEFVASLLEGFEVMEAYCRVQRR